MKPILLISAYLFSSVCLFSEEQLGAIDRYILYISSHPYVKISSVQTFEKEGLNLYHVETEGVSCENETIHRVIMRAPGYATFTSIYSFERKLYTFFNITKTKTETIDPQEIELSRLLEWSKDIDGPLREKLTHSGNTISYNSGNPNLPRELILELNNEGKLLKSTLKQEDAEIRQLWTITPVEEPIARQLKGQMKPIGTFTLKNDPVDVLVEEQLKTIDYEFYQRKF